MCVCVAVVCMLDCICESRHIFRCMYVRAWVSVFDECACVKARDSIIIAMQSEQRSSRHSKHRNSEPTINDLLHWA